MKLYALDADEVRKVTRFVQSLGGLERDFGITIPVPESGLALEGPLGTYSVVRDSASGSLVAALVAAD